MCLRYEIFCYACYQSLIKSTFFQLLTEFLLEFFFSFSTMEFTQHNNKHAEQAIRDRVAKLNASLDAWVHSNQAFGSNQGNADVFEEIDQMQATLDDMLPDSSLAGWHWSTGVNQELLEMQEEFRYVYMQEQAKSLEALLKGYISNTKLMDAQSGFAAAMNEVFTINLKQGDSSDQTEFSPEVGAKLAELQKWFAKQNDTFDNTVSPEGLRRVQTKFAAQMVANFNVELKK